MGKKTPLFDKHIELKGRMVEFAGYELPVQYEGIIAEHNAVRTKVGLFDVSHMTEFLLTGAGSIDFLERVMTNSFKNLVSGKVRYTPMCYPDGGTIDDLLIYCLEENKYIIVGNACNHSKDYEHLNAQKTKDVELVDCSNKIAQLALQGPLATSVLNCLTEQELPIGYYSFKDKIKVGTVECLVSKTGYTGEDGYELYCCSDDAHKLFSLLIAHPDVTPCGLGCRDTLRFEAGMPLYGHELTEEISPLESGLSFAVKMEKEDFIGKDELLNSPKRFRIGLKLIDRGIARGGEKVLLNGREIGFITSGTHCPTLGGAYAMAIVDDESLQYDIVIRGKNVSAQRCNIPFYNKG